VNTTKKLHLISLLLILVLSSCTYEPPPVFYKFTIKNSTTDSIEIIYNTEKEVRNYYKRISSSENFEVEFTKLQCYKDYYKDSLVSHFFETLEITSPNSNKVLNMDVFNRSNWKEKLNISEEKFCNYGDVSYTLEISDDDFE